GTGDFAGQRGNGDATERNGQHGGTEEAGLQHVRSFGGYRETGRSVFRLCYRTVTLASARRSGTRARGRQAQPATSARGRQVSLACGRRPAMLIRWAARRPVSPT